MKTNERRNYWVHEGLNCDKITAKSERDALAVYYARNPSRVNGAVVYVVTRAIQKTKRVYGWN